MTDVNNYLVYLYRNIVNGKLYVGQTHDIYKRCNESGYKGSTYFYHAIQKYGFERFEQIILKENLNSEEADYWEKFYIKFYSIICNVHFRYSPYRLDVFSTQLFFYSSEIILSFS